MPSATQSMSRWVTKGRAAALAAAVGLSLAAAGCGEALPEPIGLVPADASFVASVELGRILLDPDVASAFVSLPFGEDGPGSLEEAIAQVEEETGIDLLQFSSIVVFGVFDPTASPEEQTGDHMAFGPGGPFAILARGSFDGDTIFERVRSLSDAEVREDEYRDHALLIVAKEDGTEIAMAVLGGEVFVVGTLGALTSVIDVLEDGEGALSGPLLDAYDALGDPLVKAAFAVPAGAFDALGGGVTDRFPIPFDPALLSDIQAVGFAADKEADLVSITLTLEYASAATAEEAADYFGALLTLAGPFLPPGAAAGLIEAIEVSQAEATVTISLSATIEQLTDAAEELGADGTSLIPG